jgi:hypothetical protein
MLRFALVDRQKFTQEQWRFPKPVTIEKDVLPYFHVLATHTRGEGIGAACDIDKHQFEGLMLLRSFFKRHLACIARNCRAPWQFNASTVWLLDKKKQQ